MRETPVAGIGIVLEHTTLSSDDFCVVERITSGGPVDISGYERSNGEVRRVQVGECTGGKKNSAGAPQGRLLPEEGPPQEAPVVFGYIEVSCERYTPNIYR